MGWIGIDLDGTLAEWGRPLNTDILKIGNPVPTMVERVRALIAEGKDVRIFTARVGPTTEEECVEFKMTPEEWLVYQREMIENWCVTHIGQALPVTATKDFKMFELWDDRCKQVATNQGEMLEDAYEELAGKVGFLLKAYHLYGPEGFRFPDGDHWERPEE